MPKEDTKNTSGQKKQLTDPVVAQYRQHLEEDIDLYELCLTLWKRKFLLITWTIVAVSVSIVYVVQQPQIFIAKTIFFPPEEKDFQTLNILELQKQIIREPEVNYLSYNIDSKTVFRNFKKNLKSRKIQKKFIKEFGLKEILNPDNSPDTIDEDIYREFAEMIIIEEEDGIFALSIEFNDPEIVSQWVNDFTKFIDKETINIMAENLKKTIENKIKKIEYTITSKRALAERRREDQIIRYSEHAEIAKKLGMIGRVDATNIIQNTKMNADKTGIRRQSTATSPLYYLGYEALMTEIGILRDRKSDDPFITGLRDLQEQLALLNAINIEKENLSSVHIDEIAFTPKSPIKPNRKLIVTIAALAGIFSGIFLIFFIEFIETQRKKRSV